MTAQRDPIREWRNALEKREHGGRRALRLAPHAPLPRPFVMPLDTQVGDRFNLRRTRRLDIAHDWRLDFGSAIRVLQRHNRLIQQRFGIGWVEVTGLLIEEARRRGITTASLARLLTAGLRRDATGSAA